MPKDKSKNKFKISCSAKNYQKAQKKQILSKYRYFVGVTEKKEDYGLGIFS